MKYHNKKCICSQGHSHDSKKEAKRCNELHILQKMRYISNLEIQRKFTLIESRKYEDMPDERSVSYVADFCYMQDGKLIVEDAKGYRTKDYIIKRKIFKDKYCRSGDIIFREV